MVTTDLNDTDDVGHSARVEHFVKFGGQEEMYEVIEGVSQQPPEGGEELEPEVGQITQPETLDWRRGGGGEGLT